MRKKIFVIEDEKDMSDLLQDILEKEGYEVHKFYSGITALTSIYNKNIPDLILLDLMLPDLSGLHLCKKLSDDEETAGIPIIILTARSDEYDILNGFNFGCADYITKPFNEKILLARIKACFTFKSRQTCQNICRYKNDKNDQILKFDNLKINPSTYEVSINDLTIDLTPMEFKLIYFLAKNQNKVFKRDKIFEEIYENDYNRGDRSIDILINRIRTKLGRYGDLIDTVYGVGYSFKIEKCFA